MPQVETRFKNGVAISTTNPNVKIGDKDTDPLAASQKQSATQTLNTFEATKTPTTPASDPSTAPTTAGATTPQSTPTSIAPVAKNTPPVAPNQPVAPVAGALTAPSVVQPTDIGSRTKQGFAQGSNLTAPQDAGSARSLVASTVPNAPPDTSTIDQQLAADPVYQQETKLLNDSMSAQSQKDTLVSQYQKLIKSSGLNEINTELMNTEKIINGTEDDIRSEVTAANGFATNSQVLALASSRNKTLIQNYNNLLGTQQNIQNQINTQIQLAGQDQQAAQQRVSQSLQIATQVENYRQQFIQNAQEGYKNTVQAIGYDGLFNALKADPTTLGNAEQVLGLPKGGLSQAATVAATQRAKQDEMDNLDIQSKKATIANTYSEIGARNDAGNEYGTISGKPQNASQTVANGYADRLTQADQIISTLGNKFTAATSAVPIFNFLKSGDRKSYEQAQKNFVTAVLRQESGASIAPSEFKDAEAIYFPQRGDTPENVAQKAATRNTVINNFYREANIPRPVSPGQIIETE